MTNPFDKSSDPDRHAIWQMLVVTDSEAFVRGDWSMMEAHFDDENFEGIRCGNSSDPDDWRIVFPQLGHYRDAWLEASREHLAKPIAGMTHLEAVYRRTHLG